MRTSQYLLSTLKEKPLDAEVMSHQMMLRAGIIRKLASGLYAWLPTGVRVLKKIENIVREEMNKSGAIEILMPFLQPSEIWKKSSRLEEYGLELINITDRNNRSFVLGPTHEEVITHLIRKEIHSYKQLPLNLFQIQTKFRDERRPRFGVIRSREFLMKDAYSFHSSQASLQETYDKMRKTYSTIFSRMGLDFRVVKASSGPIGGIQSHEFQVLSKIGEDKVIFSDNSNYAAKIEFAEISSPLKPREAATKKMRLVNTLNVLTIAELVKQYHLPIKKIVKTILVKSAKGSNYPLVALLLRGDHELNKVKAEKLPQVACPLTFATKEEILTITNTSPVFLGPINLSLPLIIDQAVASMNDFIAGANIDGKHYFGINWDRDLATPEVADIRNPVIGDPSPDGKGHLQITRGIEVGHIFQLGDKYSRILNATFQGKDGRTKILMMGCYGIGITRAVSAVVEQNYNEKGIVWPESIAPFQIAILPIDIHKSHRVQKLSETLYNQLRAKGIDVLMDDRQEHPGTMFSDMDLIGIPHTVVISEKNLDNNEIEHKYLRSGKKQMIKAHTILNYLIDSIKGQA